MKIIRISFKNINNLRGENVIDFDDEPLSSAGIFAITGPTGSGKSTILDVITLSLFNKIPRFKGAISKNAIQGMGSVITHHTSEAYARLEYEIKGHKYTTEWITKNTKAGKFVDYEMSIYDVNGKPLDLKKSEVPAKNEEIIGLKYDQFVKSIILSQGQFAKFLKANKDERGQLLENLTGSSIYRKIGVATFEKHRTIKNESMMERDRLDNIVCLSSVEREELQKEIKEAAELKSKVDVALKAEVELRQVKQEISHLKTELQAAEIKEKRVLAEEHAFTGHQRKIEIYDKLAPLRGEMTRYHDAQKTEQNLSSGIETVEKQLEIASGEYATAMRDMTELTGKPVDDANYSAVMSAFEKVVNEYDHTLRNIAQKGKEVRSSILLKAKNASIDLGEKPSPAQGIPILAKMKSECEIALNTASIKEDDNVKMVREELLSLSQNLQKLKDLNHGYQHVTHLKSKIEQGQHRLNEYSKEILKFEPLISKDSELIEATTSNLQLLEKSKQDEMLIASLTDHRGSLVDGEPCPLCGAVDHPYTVDLPTQNREIDDKIAKVKEQLENYKAELQLHNRTLTSNKTSLDMTEKALTQLDEELKAQLSRQAVLLAEYAGEQSAHTDHINKSIDELGVMIADKTIGIQKLEELKSIDEIVVELERLASIMTEYKEVDTLRKSKYKGKDVSTDCNVLQDKYVNAKTKKAAYHSRLTDARNALSDTEKILATTKRYLLDPLSEIGFSSIIEAHQSLMSEEELSELKKRQQHIVREKAAISAHKVTLENKLKKTTEMDTKPEVELAHMVESINVNESLRDNYLKTEAEKKAILKKDDEDQLRLKNKAKELESINTKLEKWDLLNKMIGDRNGNKFANFAQGLTLQNLLVYANRRLSNLSDRYLLDKPNGDGPLTVLDQYQGNIQRSVTTLSGGESFLISLALALSLSDMASKNVKLESLFIDEGFGTLDQDTLEVAMNTLEKLQTESQKTVGVISHVETLKERINVQIKLQKDAMGYSAISVES